MGLFLYLIPVAVFAFYKWLTLNNDYFEKQGIPYVTIFSWSALSLFFKKQPFVQILMDGYNLHKKDKVYGAFQFRRPTVQVVDPKIAKLLTIKEFDHFADRRFGFDEKQDPLFGKSLIALKGQKWRDMRSTLSPAFTGSRMRQMFQFINEVGKQTAKTMSDDIKAGKGSVFEFEALAMRFTVDVIASCAFGIEVNSFKNPDNEFYKTGMKITKLNSFRVVFKMIGYALSPKLMEFFKVRFIDDEVYNFIREATIGTMKAREKNGIIRHDMIHLLMEARKGQLAHNNNAEEKIVDGYATVEESQIGKSDVNRVWDDDDLSAQCLIFFLGGFASIATAMSTMAYELVCNQDIQQRLYEEIMEMENQLDGKPITYEQLQGLKYLDQVVSETLRKWPVTPLIDRNCIKEYVLKFDDKSLKFTTDMNFQVPIHCFHHDPEYFPEPEKFDPERFNDENRKNIDPDTYLPFGIGPRNCIGSRFALMELKAIFYNLLQVFSFEVTEKTKIPFEYEKAIFAMRPDGYWVGLKPRN